MSIPVKFKNIITILKSIKREISSRGANSIRDKYHAHRRNLTEIVFTDFKNRSLFMTLDEQGMHMFFDAKEKLPDLRVYADMDTILNILDGRLKIYNTITGEDEYTEYRFRDAYRYGDLRAEGISSAADFVGLDTAFGDNRTEIRDMLNEIR